MLWLAVVVLALGLVGQYVIYRGADPGAIGHATWAFQPRTFNEVVAKAPLAVQAQVISVAPGPDIVVSAPSEPGGQDVIPTEHVQMKVLSNAKAGKGAPDAASGQEITVFRTGGATVNNVPAPPAGNPDPAKQAGVTEHSAPPSGGKPSSNAAAPPHPRAPANPGAPNAAASSRIFILGDDPAYKTGETYFLFLEPGPNGTLRPVSPEGRYLIVGGRAVPVTDTPVALGAAGRPTADLVAAAQGTLSIPNSSVGKRVSTEGEDVLPGMPRTGLLDQSWLLILVAAIAILLSLGLGLRRRQMKM